MGKTEEIARPDKPDSPPPEYRVDQLPEEDLLASVRSLNLTKTATASKSNVLPTNDECIAHLKLLAALANLRDETAETDGLFGINDSLAAGFSGQSRDELLVKIREKRWAVYVTRAVDRFQKWWQTCLPEAHLGSGDGGRFRMEDILQSGILQAGHFEKTVLQAQPLSWKTSMLPPLDVLMILHSFMLNPRVFLEDCIRHGKLSLWHAGFPWALVNESIDNKTFDYRTSPEAVEAFTGRSSLHWDNLQGPTEKTISCANCAKPVQCLYTNSTSFDPFQPFETSTGFADKSFEAICQSCSTKIVPESLRIRKFRSDMQDLLKYNIPMPGTLLSLNGNPESVKSSVDPTKHEVFFPNRLILAGLHTDLMEQTNPEFAYDFDRVRRSIERGLRDRSLVTKANRTTLLKTLKRGEKIAIRRMMSRYWENSSPFALDLVGAVLRQGVFVEKMKVIDWIHSPALESTITRLIAKYTVFFKIMAQNPGHIAVPTLDVDLAWHTHQLSPAYYYAYAASQPTGEFIDHDDKIEENKLSTAFEWTSKRYQKLTGGEVYSECTCWYCEAIRESHNHQSLISSSETSNAKSKALGLHDRKDIASNPEKNPHISAHNAVKTASSAGARIAARQQYKLERDYEKAVQRATRSGKTPPTRNAYAYNYVWGYPMYMPIYYPYFADPCMTGGMYACNPVGINTSFGTAGNCAAGSCGGGVAAGACASASGGCGSAAAGACGGAGGGGGGGCGGGGGGFGGGGGGGGGGGVGGGGGGGRGGGGAGGG
jgi:hypothetical protein